MRLGTFNVSVCVVELVLAKQQLVRQGLRAHRAAFRSTPDNSGAIPTSATHFLICPVGVRLGHTSLTRGFVRLGTGYDKWGYGLPVPLLDTPMFRASTMLLDHAKEKFAVGATTFTLQIPTRTFGSAVLMRKPKPRPALQLSEIAFSVYYPTHSGLSAKKHRYLDWVVRWSDSHDLAVPVVLTGLIVFHRPIRGSLAGIAHFTGKHRILLNL